MDLSFGSIQLNFDWSWIYDLGTQPIYVIAWHFIVNGGWIMFAATFIYGGWKNFVYMQENKYFAKQTFVYLAVDIPRNNLQTPKAVENIFTSLAGTQANPDWYERNIKGEFQLAFSFEIVSIDGFIQFLIRTPSQFRSLVEAAVFSQYPEAEIAEVADYSQELNIRFPNNDYNLWGSDLALVKDSYLPIKTYIDFQEELDKEFKDPMASLLEVMSKIGPGEQLWIQIMVCPIEPGWEKVGMKQVNKLLGLKEVTKITWLDKLVDLPAKALVTVGDELMRGLDGSAAGAAKEEKKDEFNMMRLAPKEKAEIEAIMEKVGKVCFNCKMRFIYIGKKEVFKKGLGVSGIVGAFKQFSSTHLNGLKPDKNKTLAKYLFKDARMAEKQNAILKAYRGRNMRTTKGPYLFNVAELATLYHFPYIEVKGPLVKKISARKTRAPIGLPLDDSLGPAIEAERIEASQPGIDYNNDYFEKRFAVDKTGEKDRQRKQEIFEQLKKEKVEEDIVEDEELKEHWSREIQDSKLKNYSPKDESVLRLKNPKEEIIQEEESTDNEADNHNTPLPPAKGLPGNLPFVK